MRNTASSSNRPHVLSIAWRIVGVGLFVAYPPVTHYALSHGAISLALGMLACLALYVLISLLPANPFKWLLLAILPGLLLLPPMDLHWLLYLPPILINLALCWLFGRTLKSGGRPMISRFAELEHGQLMPDLATYTRWLTWIWTGFFLVMALVSFLLAAFASENAWAMFTNVINYLLVATLFAAEYVYRLVRYRHYKHDSPLQLIRRICAGETFRQ